jgi:hypothetical protein
MEPLGLKKETQVYSIDVIRWVNYISTISDFLYTSYQKMLYLSKFNVTNEASATININGLGVKNIIKPTVYGLHLFQMIY